VNEELTTKFAASVGASVIPCGCSQKTGTVRRSLRDMLNDLEREYPRLKDSLLSALGNIETSRLLDPRYLSLDGEELVAPDPLRVLGNDDGDDEA
jgi:tRNA 2-thiocytidine biosynthesis protein TtcA